MKLIIFRKYSLHYVCYVVICSFSTHVWLIGTVSEASLIRHISFLYMLLKKREIDKPLEYTRKCSMPYLFRSLTTHWRNQSKIINFVLGAREDKWESNAGGEHSSHQKFVCRLQLKGPIQLKE